MKQKKIYTEAPEDVSRAINEGEIVTDFLPPAKELIRKLNKKIAKNPIVIDNGNQIRELNRT